ncbi:MAG: hypothetical protein ABIK31_04510 [candidate division WOR-3 bacterium]
MAIKIGGEDDPNYIVNYHYRLLCFTAENEEPVLAYNLESSKIHPDRFFLCCHTPEQHINYGPADKNMSYSKFKAWAISVINKKNK